MVKVSFCGHSSLGWDKKARASYWWSSSPLGKEILFSGHSSLGGGERMKASSSLGGKREILFSELSSLGWGERAKASYLISEHSSSEVPFPETFSS